MEFGMLVAVEAALTGYPDPDLAFPDGEQVTDLPAREVLTRLREGQSVGDGLFEFIILEVAETTEYQEVGWAALEDGYRAVTKAIEDLEAVRAEIRAELAQSRKGD